MTKKFDNAACVRSLRLLERSFIKWSEEYAKSPDEFDRQRMAKCSLADAADMKRLAQWVARERYVTAFRFWRMLDTFVRDLVPIRTINFIAAQAVKEFEVKKLKKRH